MIKSLYYFLRLIYLQRGLILSMAKREVRSRYIGSLLGFIWTFVQPIALICIFWVVFSLGFRVQPMKDAPFVVWLTAGMAGWFVFSDIVLGSASCVIGNAHLVKKVVFHAHVLPVIKVVSCTITHLIFLSVLLSLIFFQKMPFSLYYLQVTYYFGCMCILALGIGWFVSALNVFFRDVGQIVAVFIQIGFWATPIFWDIQMMPAALHPFIKLNPMFYIVQGYRESFIYFQPFWHHPIQTAYFWILTLSIFSSGALVFKKLKPHFADVL